MYSCIDTVLGWGLFKRKGISSWLQSQQKDPWVKWGFLLFCVTGGPCDILSGFCFCLCCSWHKLPNSVGKKHSLYYCHYGGTWEYSYSTVMFYICKPGWQFGVVSLAGNYLLDFVGKNPPCQQFASRAEAEGVWRSLQRFSSWQDSARQGLCCHPAPTLCLGRKPAEQSGNQSVTGLGELGCWTATFSLPSLAELGKTMLIQ